MHAHCLENKASYVCEGFEKGMCLPFTELNDMFFLLFFSSF